MKVNIALLTVTDTRTIDNDKSGAILVDKIKLSNHNLIDRKICKDDKDQIVLILNDFSQSLLSIQLFILNLFYSYLSNKLKRRLKVQQPKLL